MTVSIESKRVIRDGVCENYIFEQSDCKIHSPITFSLSFNEQIRRVRGVGRLIDSRGLSFQKK